MIRTVHTSGPDAPVRELLEGVFGDEFEESDWEHCLGGMHVLAYDGGSLIGHAAVVMRRMLHGARALRCGYVEGVAVRGDRQRGGVGRALMEEVARIVTGAYDLGALGTTDEGRRLYEQAGWERWRGPLRALTPDGVVDTPDEAGGVYVLCAAAPLDLDAPLTCDWRDGDVW